MLVKLFIWMALHKTGLRNAIFIVAAYAGSTWVLAINDEKILLETERLRLAEQRSTIEAQYTTDRQNCYQKFEVTACINQASGRRNVQLADVKRQQVALDDGQRKRKGAEKIQRLEEKTTPEFMQKQAERRERALAQDANRQQRAMERAQANNTRVANSFVKLPTQKLVNNEVHKRPPVKKVPQPAPRKLKITPSHDGVQARQAYERRQRDALEHKRSVEKRLQDKKKPPAAPLPVPTN